MYKKYLVYSITIVGIMLYSYSYTGALNTNIECFRYSSTIQATDINQDTLYISSIHNDLFATQQDTSLGYILYDNAHKYIPFKTNISQSTKGDEYENMYSFGDIDTDETKEIVIEFESPLKKGDFSMNFVHDSKYYISKYYISENGAQSYSQVLQSDIADYSVTHIKISFQKKGREPIREIIKISELLILDKNTHVAFTGVNQSKNVLIYAQNTCGQTRDKVKNSYEKKEKSNFLRVDYIQNSLYKEDSTDTDKDGISDLHDNCKRVKNADQKDINQNLVGDACEFDSDSDTIPDEIDNCRNIKNTDQEDDDRDNIGNVCDNCDIYNPAQTDSDSNGIGDICDEQTTFLKNNDSDSDGILNSVDNCRDISNPDQGDDDNDGLGNVCDNCKLFQNFEQTDLNDNGIGDICEDSDNDGVDSINDNCINTPNPDQKDDDNDGIGNVCEDDDRDGVIFTIDNCPYESNSDQLDTDSDGLGDVCDNDDNRFLESNKPIFILLLLLVIAGFVGAIFMMMRKLQK